ncbi:MAG TPA: T9SS type A sorting domain-containing protein, partial [Candidatus Kapabacteria bacterium]|nr:T9SS type A sorting domain-containing protein [Candidatus Kapabacteria bacterium]
SATTIMFNTASEGNVTLKIYNALGNEVTTLVSDRLAAGAHSAQWDTNNLPQGVYYYQLQAGGKTQTKKIVLVK